jgi:hypothetical protein
MYKQWMKAIILTITSLVTILPQVSVAAPKGFQSPSGNIFCELVYGISLRCEISSSLKPKPPQPYPGYCQFDWGQGFLLTAEGKPEILCISDTIADKTGLTCTNSSGIGFFLSREKWRVLGTHPTY